MKKKKNLMHMDKCYLILKVAGSTEKVGLARAQAPTIHHQHHLSTNIQNCVTHASYFFRVWLKSLMMLCADLLYVIIVKKLIFAKCVYRRCTINYYYCCVPWTCPNSSIENKFNNIYLYKECFRNIFLKTNNTYLIILEAVSNLNYIKFVCQKMNRIYYYWSKLISTLNC